MPSPSERLDQYFSAIRQNPWLGERSPSSPFTLLDCPSDILSVEERRVSELKASGLPSDWGRVGLAYEDQYLLGLRDAVRFPSGQTGTYIRFFYKPLSAHGVVVLPLLKGEFVFLRQYRHATNRWHLEAPRGFAKDGEPANETARRELHEELGATARELRPLGQMFPDTGIIGTGVSLFLAELESLGQVNREEGIAEPVRLAPSAVDARIAGGDICDGMTISAVATARSRSLVT